MDVRTRRIGENEALFRDVNERVKEVSDGFGVVLDDIDLVCECGNLDCVERIHLNIPAYEHLRADPALFAVRPGHEIPDTEDVVGEGGDYLVVRKKPGGPAELAADLDPRS
jgi:hypothetical protein